MAEKPITAARLLHDHLLQHGDSGGRDRTALIADGRSHTFGDLLQASQRLAGALRSRGVGRGDRVAIYLGNTWTGAAGIFGTLIGGGVLVNTIGATFAGDVFSNDTATNGGDFSIA